MAGQPDADLASGFQAILETPRSIDSPDSRDSQDSKPEVESPAPAKPAPKLKVVPKPEEGAADELDALEAEAAPEETPEETPAESPADETPAEDEDAEVETFDQLAKGYGVEPAALLAQLKVTDADGKLVPLSEIVDHYRGRSQAGELKSQLEAKYVEFDGKIKQFDAARDEQLGKIQQLSSALMAVVEQDQKVDLAKLRLEDPAKAALFIAEATARRDLMRQALEAQREEAGRRQETVSEQRRQWMLDEGKKFRVARPEIFATPEAHRTFMTDVEGALNSAGFKPGEVEDFLPDARVLSFIADAIAYRKLKAKGPLTLQRLKEVQKVVPQQVRQTPKDPKAEKLKMSKVRHAKNQTVESLAATFALELEG